MFRFIAFFWNPLDAQACAVACRLIDKCRCSSSAWRAVVDRVGFAVLAAGALAREPSFLAVRDSGVILGDLFRSSTASPTRCIVLSDEESARIASSGARQLVASYWGNYVALLVDAKERTRWVLRGPASTLPCLHSPIEGVDVYFSWTEEFARLAGNPLSINWRQVARSLMGPMHSTQTGLNEIEEILPGFCEEVSERRRTLHRYWDPVRVARTAPFRSFQSAAARLRDVTLSCARAWAPTSGRIALGLSGGLDSSIVLGCLREMPSRPEIVCFTYFSEGPDSDERVFARLAAKRADCRQVERLRHADVDLSSVLSQVRLERSSGMRTPLIDRLEPDAARDVGARALFKGHGGDELFCRHHTQFYIADLLRSRGLSAGLLDQLTHSAVTEGENIWKVFFRALGQSFVPRRWDVTAIFRDDREDQSLLHPEVLSSVLADRSFEFPFATSTRQCSPGKLWQITLITGRRRYYGPWDREGDPQSISPLLSQPVIETCLRIPTFMQMARRRERAVAREAFIREVPREILERRWKGGTEQLAWKMFQRNLPFVREFLLDGVLARRGILDRVKLESVLSGAPSSLIRVTVPVFELIGMEAWFHAWSGRGVRSMQ